MKTYNLKQWTILLGIAGIGLMACEKEDDDNSEPKDNNNETEAEGYTMPFKTTGGDETEFIITEKEIMNGEISAENQGIEQQGWRFYYQVGNTLFSSGYSQDNKLVGYQPNGNGNLEEKTGFTFDNALEMFGHSDDGETLLAMEIPRAGFGDRKLYFVDAQSAYAKKIVNTPIYENQADSIVAWPTALQVRGNKLFVPFHMLHADGSFRTLRPDTAYVAVYNNYPDIGNEPDTIIKDPRTCNIGANGHTTGLIEAENGDLYSFSCGAKMAGFAPAASKPSGILRIKNGETTFDDNYFLDIEAKTGGELFWFAYVGNNKAIGRILTHDNGAAWGAYGRNTFNQKLVIIDLVNQTVTDVANVPSHAKRYISSPMLVEDGNVYTSIETESEAHVYKIDIDQAKGTKGAEIKGKTIKGFHKFE